MSSSARNPASTWRISGAAQRWASCRFSIFHPLKLTEMGDAVPQTHWDFPLCRLKRQRHAGLGVPSPACRLQASSRRSGCVPAVPYPPLERSKAIRGSSPNKRPRQKSTFDRTSPLANYKLSPFAVPTVFFCSHRDTILTGCRRFRITPLVRGIERRQPER